MLNDVRQVAQYVLVPGPAERQVAEFGGVVCSALSGAECHYGVVKVISVDGDEESTWIQRKTGHSPRRAIHAQLVVELRQHAARGGGRPDHMVVGDEKPG